MFATLLDLAIMPDPIEILSDVLPYLLIGLIVAGVTALAVVLIVIFTRNKKKK